MHLLVSLAILTGGAHYGGPAAWLTQPLAPKVSSEWSEIRTDTNQTIYYLTQHKVQDRRLKLSDAIRKVRTTDHAAKDTYRAAAFALKFSEDFAYLKASGAAGAACQNSPGANDPEYARIVYLLLTKQRSGLDWPGLGGKLLKIFPDDPDLKPSLITDAVDGHASYEDSLLALSFCKEEDTTGGTSLRFLYRVANIRMSMYYINKLKRDLEASIASYNRALSIDTDNQRMASAEAILKILNRNLREKNYVGG